MLYWLRWAELRQRASRFIIILISVDLSILMKASVAPLGAAGPKLNLSTNVTCKQFTSVTGGRGRLPL